MKIEIINPLEFADWDELIQKQQGSTFFHSSHWARVLRNTYGYKLLYFTAGDNNTLSAIVPVMEIDSFITGKRGVSLPFTDLCQPIINNNIKANEIWNTLKVHGERAGWKYIEIRGGDGFDHHLPTAAWYYEHALSLSEDLQQVYSNFHDSHKRNIRKAKKMGVEVTLCDSLESIKYFYRLNLITRKRHGLPPQPFSFFKNIHQHIIEKNHGLLLIARHQEKVIAGALCLHFGDNAVYKYAASDKRFQNLRSNNLIVWKALEHYCQQGYTSFSFGRTDQGHKGLSRFKSGWGAKEQRVNYYKHSFQDKISVSTLPKVDGFHTKVFRKTPFPILRIIGSIFYKHLG